MSALQECSLPRPQPPARRPQSVSEINVAQHCSPRVVRRSVASPRRTWAPSLTWRSATSWSGSGTGPRGEAQTPRTRALSLAQVVILSVIPQATTEPNQTGLTRNAAQFDLVLRGAFVGDGSGSAVGDA